METAVDKTETESQLEGNLGAVLELLIISCLQLIHLLKNM